jgi:diguanylate cyclase (GGDEF)-like protein
MVASSVYYIGLDCGAQYYLLCAFVLFMATESLGKRMKYTISVISLVEYIVLIILMRNIKPIYALPDLLLSVFYQVSILSSFGLIVYTSLSYRSAVGQYERQLKDLQQETQNLAYCDQLTGLPNRHMLYQKLNNLMLSANEDEYGFIIGVMDIDDFKTVNDKYGHLCGDEALKHISKVLAGVLRNCDVIGRWGGEEFLIILPGLEMQTGIAIMERIRTAVSKATISCGETKLSVTVTIGCAQYNHGISLVKLLQHADELMYQGKKSGKNVVVS